MKQEFFHVKRDNNPHRQDALTFSCMGKLNPVSGSDLIEFGRYLLELLNISKSRRDIPKDVLIIGVAESGIIPSQLMHIETTKQDLKTNWICSTRRLSSGIEFKENHSHGPEHILPIPKCQISEIWIVEDEITTGNTLLNLLFHLSEHLKINSVTVFSFADFRTKEQKKTFLKIIHTKNIKCYFHNSNILGLNSTPFVKCSSVVLKEPGYIKPKYTINKTGAISGDLKNRWQMADKRPALGDRSGLCLNTNLWKVSEQYSSGTILTIGEAVDMAVCYVMANLKLTFQQITLSPWVVDNKAIFNRLEFNKKYYLYNYKNLKEPLFILSDPIDKEIEIEVIKQFKTFNINLIPFKP